MAGLSIDGLGIDLTIDAFRDLVTDGVGSGTPLAQITSGTVIGAIIIATSAVGLVATLLLLPLPIAMIVIGILRLWEPIDNMYPL